MEGKVWFGIIMLDFFTRNKTLPSLPSSPIQYHCPFQITFIRLSRVILPACMFSKKFTEGFDFFSAGEINILFVTEWPPFHLQNIKTARHSRNFYHAFWKCQLCSFLWLSFCKLGFEAQGGRGIYYLEIQLGSASAMQKIFQSIKQLLVT